MSHWISWRVQIVAPIKRSQKGGADFPTVEHPTYCGPAPPWNTLFIMDLHHHGLAPQRKNLLTVDLPHHKTPYSQWTCPPRNSLLIFDLSHHGTPYSQWTCPRRNPFQCVPAIQETWIIHPYHDEFCIQAWSLSQTHWHCPCQCLPIRGKIMVSTYYVSCKFTCHCNVYLFLVICLGSNGVKLLRALV